MFKVSQTHCLIFLTREFLQGSQSKEEATSQVAVVVIKEEVIPLNQGKKSIFKGK